MITSLAPLGVTHAIQLALLFDGKGSVTVTALMRPKKFKTDSNDNQDSVDLSGLRTVQVSGTIEEVQAELATHLTSAVAKLVKHTKTIDDLDAVLAADLAEKKKAVEATLAANKKTASSIKPTTKPAKGGKPITVTADDDAEPPEDDEPPVATATAPTIAGLQPAWKSLKAPARDAAKNPAPIPVEVGSDIEDLSSFFKE